MILVGSSPYLPLVRRRVDIPREKCVIQDGIE
jgi:hypothetical protein